MLARELAEKIIKKDIVLDNVHCDYLILAKNYIDLEKLWVNQKRTIAILNPDNFLELKAKIRSQETEITKLKYQIKSVLDHNEAIEKKNFQQELELKRLRFDK